MKATVFYIGSSLLAPLKQAEREINREYELDLRIAAYNFGASLTETEWREVEGDLSVADVVFVIHVMDGENAARLLPALERFKEKHRAVVVINCMPELMRRTRMGRLDFGQLFKKKKGEEGKREKGEKEEGLNGQEAVESSESGSGRARSLARSVATWMGEQARAHRKKKSRSHTTYLKLVDRMPALLKIIPNAGRLRDVKNYLYLFCYFLQPTPANIRSMILSALKEYVPDERLSHLKIPKPEAMPAVALYHPDAPALFE
ncbi:MAG: DUF3479 domain-containing protein, partial [Pyrinomonadaceae bacterium]|nr:DUF3479 domain-containing protein [Pyrinomonadaceae bacterium]